MKLKLKKERFPALIDGAKTSTSRLGHRTATIGEELIIEMTENPKIHYIGQITNIRYCTLSELTEKEAIAEGYTSLTELKANLIELYNPRPNDEFTLIHFK